MQLRHAYCRSETINSSYGMIKVDARGYVTNVDELRGTAEQILRYLPDFINADLFPQPEPLPEKVTPPDPKVPATPTLKEATDEKYALIFKELIEAGAPTNSQGYLEMGNLNEELKKRGIKILSGQERIRLTDQYDLKRQEPGKNEGKRATD